MRTKKNVKKGENCEFEKCGTCGKKFSMYKYIKGSYVYKYKQTYFCGYKCWKSFVDKKEKEREKKEGYSFKEENCRNCSLLRKDGSCPRFEVENIPNDEWCEGWIKRRRTQKPIPDNVPIQTIKYVLENKIMDFIDEIQCKKYKDYLENKGEYNQEPCYHCEKKANCGFVKMLGKYNT